MQVFLDPAILFFVFGVGRQCQIHPRDPIRYLTLFIVVPVDGIGIERWICLGAFRLHP